MSDTKPTNPNPKDLQGIKKVPLHVIPPQVLSEIGLALMEGSRKYSRFNWRAAGVRSSVYYDAAMRHLLAYWEGQDVDPDSGVSHLVKAIAGLMVLRDAERQGMVTDDRPFPAKNQSWVVDANKKAGEIIGRYPDAVQDTAVRGCEAKGCKIEGHIELRTDNAETFRAVQQGQRELVSGLIDDLVALNPDNNVVLDNGVVKVYDSDGLLVREYRPKTKEEALHECETRYGVAFEKE